MKRFIAQLNDNSYINVPADHMEVKDNAIFVHNGQELVAWLDVGCVLTAHMSEKVQG